MNLCYTGLKMLVKAYQALLPQDCRVSGADHILRGARIIAANHPNYTDTFYLVRMFDEPLHTLINANTISIPGIERLLALSGQIMVEPEKKQAALPKACEYLANGGTVLIYPEGCWNPENKRLKGKTGAIRLALISGAPIIPLGIYVPDDCTHTIRDHKNGRLRQARWQKKGHCYLCFGDPWLPFQEIFGIIEEALIYALTDTLMEKIYDLSQNARLMYQQENVTHPISIENASMNPWQ